MKFEIVSKKKKIFLWFLFSTVWIQPLHNMGSTLTVWRQYKYNNNCNKEKIKNKKEINVVFFEKKYRPSIFFQ